MRRAPRVAWQIEHGALPTASVLHYCDYRPCVRPSHLFTGDQAVNIADMMAKERFVVGNRYGERNGSAVITAPTADSIRSAFDAGERICDIARRLHVSESIVSRVAHRRTWPTSTYG